MNPRLSTLFIWCAALLLASASQAQVVRPSETIYVLLRGGAALYYGDLDGNPDGNDDAAVLQPLDGFSEPGFAVGAELGYQFNPNLSLGLGYTYNYHERLNNFDNFPELEANNTHAHQANLLFRYLPFDAAKLSPFVELGGAFIVGNGRSDVQVGDDESFGYGPVLGLGFDLALSPQFSIFLGAQSTLVFPDVALDGANPGGIAGVTGDDSDFDVLANVGGGLKYAFRPPYVRAEIEGLQCPSELVAGETGSFMVMTNEDATMPVTYSWQWGDGTTGSGMNASHAFSSPGTYTVTAMVMNEGGEDSESCLVTVVEPPDPPVLAGCRATPARVNPGEEVSINATATDADEIRVDFGDGSSASTLPARHAYTETGNYTVTITATNQYGTDTCTIQVTVGDTYCQEITELNPVFFGYGASTLTADARARLDENIEILRRCPDICTTIYGYTDDREGDQMRLSQRRADAVMEYYVSQGIDADRLRAEGRGQDPDANSKEDPGPGDSRARRADSIPSSCAGFDSGMMDMDDSDN